jgi:hypothetical protein
VLDIIRREVRKRTGTTTSCHNADSGLISPLDRKASG